MVRSSVRLSERKEIVGYLPFNPPVPIAELRYELQSEAVQSAFANFALAVARSARCTLSLLLRKFRRSSLACIRLLPDKESKRVRQQGECENRRRL